MSQLCVIWWVLPSSPFPGPTHFNSLSPSCRPAPWSLYPCVSHSLCVSIYGASSYARHRSGREQQAENAWGLCHQYWFLCRWDFVPMCLCLPWFPPPSHPARAAQAWLPSGPTSATSSVLSTYCFPSGARRSSLPFFFFF